MDILYSDDSSPPLWFLFRTNMFNLETKHTIEKAESSVINKYADVPNLTNNDNTNINLTTSKRVLKYDKNNYSTFRLYILVLVSTICIVGWLTFLVGVNTALEYDNIEYVLNDILIVYSLCI